MNTDYKLKIITEEPPTIIMQAILVQLNSELSTLNSIQSSIAKLPAMRDEVMSKINELVSGLIGVGLTVELVPPSEDEVPDIQPEIEPEPEVVEPEVQPTLESN